MQGKHNTNTGPGSFKKQQGKQLTLDQYMNRKPAPLVKCQESQAEKIKSALMRIEAKYKGSEVQKQKAQVPVIEILSSSQEHSQSAMMIEEQNQIEERKQTPDMQMEDENAEDNKQEISIYSSEHLSSHSHLQPLSSLSSFIQEQVPQPNLEIEPILQPQSHLILAPPQQSEEAEIEVIDVGVDATLQNIQLSTQVIEMRQQDGEDVIDFLEYGQIRTYKRAKAEQLYMYSLIDYYEKHLALNTQAVPRR